MSVFERIIVNNSSLNATGHQSSVAGVGPRSRVLVNNNSHHNTTTTSTNSSLDACKVPTLSSPSSPSQPLPPPTVNSLASTVGSASANFAIVPTNSPSVPHDNNNNPNNSISTLKHSFFSYLMPERIL